MVLASYFKASTPADSPLYIDSSGF